MSYSHSFRDRSLADLVALGVSALPDMARALITPWPSPRVVEDGIAFAVLGTDRGHEVRVYASTSKSCGHVRRGDDVAFIDGMVPATPTIPNLDLASAVRTLDGALAGRALRDAQRGEAVDALAAVEADGSTIGLAVAIQTILANGHGELVADEAAAVSLLGARLLQFQSSPDLLTRVLKRLPSTERTTLLMEGMSRARRPERCLALAGVLPRGERERFARRYIEVATDVVDAHHARTGMKAIGPEMLGAALRGHPLAPWMRALVESAFHSADQDVFRRAAGIESSTWYDALIELAAHVGRADVTIYVLVDESMLAGAASPRPGSSQASVGEDAITIDPSDVPGVSLGSGLLTLRIAGETVDVSGARTAGTKLHALPLRVPSSIFDSRSTAAKRALIQRLWGLVGLVGGAVGIDEREGDAVLQLFPGCGLFGGDGVSIVVDGARRARFVHNP